MIGSRGTDKVIICKNFQYLPQLILCIYFCGKEKTFSCWQVAQVPVGTVIHLVSGDFPSEESSSTKSLDPWEIPVGEVNQDSPAPLINKWIGGSCSMVPEDYHDSSLPHKDADNKLVHDIEKRSGSASLTEAESEDDIKSDESYDETSCIDVKSNETDGDVEDCSGNGIIGPEDEEEMEEEYKEEVVQYSVAELTQPGQRIVVARGGEGGLGNVASQKSQKSCRRVNYQISAPSPKNLDETSAGKPGSESVLVLELKSIADVGLVGMPNAGKSTLLGALSMAKPTVGNYAFTTLRPNIGNLNYEDFFSVKVADIPGLIQGAHANRGLGHAFLRHIERTKVLVYVVDLAAALDGKKGIPPWEQLRDLVLELEYHQEGMSNRPSLIVANKIDEDGAEDVLKEFERRVQGVPIFPVCAILQEGIPELKYGIRRLIDGSELRRVDLDSILVD